MDKIKTGPFSYTLVPDHAIYLYLKQFARNGTHTVGTSQFLPATGEITEGTVMDYGWKNVSGYFVQKMTGVINGASLAKPEELARYNTHNLYAKRRIGRRW